ncbi:MAG: DpnII family type II restriction endonuclease [Thermodesulfovibrionales bacterium]|nr:DpnII family type II restriction endonuclease [Thermodesulfovibrionales bacterium]
MNKEARKLTFEEAWESATAFLIDEEIENKLDSKIDAIVRASSDARIARKPITIENVTSYLTEKKEALEVILAEIALSQEKFLRIVSLLRRIGRIGSEFDSEWHMDKIKAQLKKDNSFALTIARLLVEGVKDTELQSLLPRYYLEKLNLKEVAGEPEIKRRLNIKEQESRKWYGNLKGQKVENVIKGELEKIKSQHGIPYDRGRIELIHTDADWVVPLKEDPYIVIMVSFQETTSSGQTNKARDMFKGYEKVRERNVRYRDKRVFINFVDGIGWLARKADFKRLVEECHYFLNLKNLDMLESIVCKHTPKKYFGTSR